MKKIQLAFCMILANFAFALGQTTENIQNINTPVVSAIIYLYGAEVAQTKQVTLNPGRNKIVFVGLSPKLDAKSIQVNASGDVSILAISDAVNYMANQKESTKIKLLRDSIAIISDGLTQNTNDKDAFTIEKNMLLKNDAMSGKDKGIATSDLKLAADFYRSRIKEINAEISKLDKKNYQLNEILSKETMELEELNASNNQPTSEITILLNSTIKTTSAIDLKYIVTDAGWAPSYELHAEDINQPVELKYRAKVYNNTGIDWNDIKIKLSTADPSQSASKPVLEPWNLDYFSQGNYKTNYGSVLESGEGYMQNKMVTDNNEISTQKPAAKVTIAQPVKFEEIQVSELSAEFDIKINYTIPADSKPYIVDVTEYKLPATYQHYSAPKLVRDAFLLARITGWEDLDLVEGPANVYYGGSYVGQSYIYTRSVDDTLDLSLGRDNKVLVTRSKVKEFCNKKLSGNVTKETFAYEMVVKNNRKTPIQIDVEDQLPISSQSDITVEAIETSKADFDPKTGKYTWTYTVQPGEIKKIELSYAVKYPKSTKVQMEKMRSVSAPSF